MSYPYRYRYRRFRSRRDLDPRVLAAGVGVMAALVTGAGVAHHHDAGHHHHKRPPAAAGASAPAGGSYTPRTWAPAFLAAAGLPATRCNLAAVIAWERAEGGGFGNQAAYNPLNVNPGPGAGWPGHNAIGAWAFPDDRTGLRYTVRTLDNGNYGGVISALRSGGNAQAVCNAIMASPWAASHYNGNLTASC